MQGSRSTALKALLYLDAISFVGISSVSAAGAAIWVQVFLACLLTMSFVSTLAAYFYFMFKDPDALRSEKFAIDKLSIEKGIVGDSISGLSRVSSSNQTISIGKAPVTSIEHEGRA